MTFDDFKDTLDQVENGDHLKDRISARNELLAWAQAALESRVLAERKEEPISDDYARLCSSDWLNVLNEPATHPTPDDASGPAITADVHADAARYRFIRRGKALTVHVPVNDKSVTYCLIDKPEAAYGESLDAAIDRARQSGEEGK